MRVEKCDQCKGKGYLFFGIGRKCRKCEGTGLDNADFARAIYKAYGVEPDAIKTQED